MPEDNAESKNKCLCEAENVVFLPCSGASNCGQIANQVAVNLTKEGLGNMYCLAGLGAHIDGMVNSAKSADKIIVLDGCLTACAQKVLQHLGISAINNVCVSELGIAKNHEFNLNNSDIAMVADHIRKILSN